MGRLSDENPLLVVVVVVVSTDPEVPTTASLIVDGVLAGQPLRKPIGSSTTATVRHGHCTLRYSRGRLGVSIDGSDYQSCDDTKSALIPIRCPITPAATSTPLPNLVIVVLTCAAFAMAGAVTYHYVMPGAVQQKTTCRCSDSCLPGFAQSAGVPGYAGPISPPGMPGHADPRNKPGPRGDPGWDGCAGSDGDTVEFVNCMPR